MIWTVDDLARAILLLGLSGREQFKDASFADRNGVFGQRGIVGLDGDAPPDQNQGIAGLHGGDITVTVGVRQCAPGAL
jgi:hypothetical protein